MSKSIKLGLSYGISVILLAIFAYLPAIIFSKNYLAFPFVITTIIAGLSPFIVLIIFLKKDHTTIKAFFQSFITKSLYNKKSFGLLIIALMALTILPIIIENIIIQEWRFFASQISLFIPIGFIFGGLEEFGWRGYMQPKLNELVNPFIGSLVVGFIWAIWHIPLFFIEGTYQQSLGLFSLEFWFFFASLIIASPFYTFLLFYSKHALWVVVLYHGLSNVLREILIDVNVVTGFLVELMMSLIVIIIFRNYFFNKNHNKNES